MAGETSGDTDGGGGMYAVKESGVEFQHKIASDAVDSDVDLIPTTPEIFLGNFRNFRMRVLERPSKDELVFEMVHVDVSFVNALRRIMLSEIPTVAIEAVYMWNNSSIVHDEVLSHRLGLVPIYMDARLLDEVEEDEEYEPTDRNTVVFRLAVTCPSKPPPEEKSAVQVDDSATDDDDYVDETVVKDVGMEEAAADAAQSGAAKHFSRKFQYPRDRPYTKHVYSSDLVWVPQGDQGERFADSDAVRPIHDDILIAKLRPGQAIELEAHGRRGIGKDHAKFSPVATASYRLMPKIELLHPVYDELADELVHVYEPGVFELVPTDPEVDPPHHSRKARVCNPYACTMSRNFMRNPQLKESIRMSRIPDHFIFSVESVGMYDPGVLVAEALRLLQNKCQRAIDLADECIESTANNAM